MLHLRAEWADRHPSMTPAKKGVGHVVIHHTAGSASLANKAATLRGLEHSVTDGSAPGNDGGLVAIDYSVLVFADGDVWAGRGFQYEDAATLRFNAQSVSICAVGNYHIDRPPPALLQGIAYATQLAIVGGWVVPNSSIIGHRDVGTFATACPGQYLEAQLPEIRRLVAGGAGVIVDPAPEQPEEGFDMTEFFWRDPKTKTIYHFAGNSNHALVPGNKNILALAAAKEKPSRVIVDLGDLNAKQVADMLEFPTTR